MKILITGVKGQLGSDVEKEFITRGFKVIGTDIENMDITNAAEVFCVIKNASPDAIVHCAAYTAVDAAEDNADICMQVNSSGTENIAKVCKELDIKMLYISTDYVFNGAGERMWEPQDERKPLNIYGQSKYKGELAVERILRKYFIIRISWVFGKSGNNFINTMLKLSIEKDSLRVVNDQIGSPTYTRDLAKLLADIIVTEKYGVYHATNEGFCSWYDFSVEIFKQCGIKISVSPIDSLSYNVKAKRPLNSRLSKNKLEQNGFNQLPSWQDALNRYLKEIGEIK